MAVQCSLVVGLVVVGTSFHRLAALSRLDVRVRLELCSFDSISVKRQTVLMRAFLKGTTPTNTNNAQPAPLPERYEMHGADGGSKGGEALCSVLLQTCIISFQNRRDTNGVEDEARTRTQHLQPHRPDPSHERLPRPGVGPRHKLERSNHCFGGGGPRG